MDAISAIGGGVCILVAVGNFLHWMATGEFRWRYSLKTARWPNEPVQCVMAVLFNSMIFVGGSFLLVSTLLKWLDFDSRYSP